MKSPRRAVRALVTAALAAALTGASLVAAPTIADAAVPDPVTCRTDGSFFNTGRDQATNTQLPRGSRDPIWQAKRGVYFTERDASGHFVLPGGVTPARDMELGTPWFTPTVSTDPTWATSTYGNAQWIVEPNSRRASDRFEYFRLTFTLAPEVDPSTFQLRLRGSSDDALADVLVNGNSMYQSGTAIPEAPFQQLHTLPTLDKFWQTGTNEVIFQVKDFGWAVGLLVESQQTALCPATLDITKTAAASTVHRGDVAEYAIEVSNTKANTVATQVSVEDPTAGTDLEAVDWSCTSSGATLCPVATGTGALSQVIPSLPAGDTLTYTVRATVLAGGDTTVTNTATATSAGAHCATGTSTSTALGATCSATATITATDQAPVAVDDSSTTPRTTTVTIPVLPNDSDPAGASLTVSAATAPAHGTVTYGEAGAVYTPTDGFIGTDEFTYTLTNAYGLTDTATVRVTVTGQLTYDANGGAGAVPAAVVQSEASATVSGPGELTREAHTFSGWNTAADGSGTAYAPESTIDLSQADQTLFAQWVPVVTPSPSPSVEPSTTPSVTPTPTPSTTPTVTPSPTAPQPSVTPTSTTPQPSVTPTSTTPLPTTSPTVGPGLPGTGAVGGSGSAAALVVGLLVAALLLRRRTR